MSLRLAIFDVDGTLIDSQDHIFSAMRYGFEACGHICPPRSEVLSIVGLSLPQAMAELVPHLPEAERESIVEKYKASFGELRARGAAPLYPGISEMLELLAADDSLLLGVATGKSRRGLRAMIEAHGLEGRFLTLQTADTHPSKPHPSMIATALAETGVSAENAVMIGDTSFDMAMARNAGVMALGVAWGYHEVGALQAAGAHQVVHDVAAIPGLLATMIPVAA